MKMTIWYHNERNEIGVLTKGNSFLLEKGNFFYDYDIKKALKRNGWIKLGDV